MRRKTDPTTMGVIEDGAVYPMTLFCQRAGLGKHALTQLRRQGLQVIRTGGRVFVRGRDFNEFLGRLAGGDGINA